MNNIKYVLSIFLILIVQFSFAQIKVSGTVTSKEDGQPLPGVSVLIEGTQKGTTTDFDGKYFIESNTNDVLVFSFIGMISKKFTVGSSTTGSVVVDMIMETDTQVLDDVVVTALGIQRSAKTLTYAQQAVEASQLTETRDINIMNSLSGRAAGVDIKKSSSGAGGSTKVVLRGAKSISGDSQPLFVIDGIPMANNRGSQVGMWGGTDEGDGLSQLNPDDIESINILRGANAAVLYGSQGANGVVVITTKKGKEGKMKISLNSGVTFENVIETPQLQFKYGAEDGAKESWSNTKGNTKYTQSDVDAFFKTGYNLINGVSISGSAGSTTAFFSYSNTISKGIIENNEYSKHNISLRQSTKFFDDKIKLSSNLMLTQEKSKNRNPAGYYLNPLTGLYFFPRERDFSQYKEYEKFDNLRNMKLQNWFVNDHHQSNPYWIINKQPKEDITKRVIANLALEYNILESLKFQVRGNYDYAIKSFEHKIYAGSNTTNSHANGRWDYKKYDDRLLYTDALLTYNNEFGDFSLNAVLGMSYQRADYGVGVAVNTDTNGLKYANEFHFGNIADNVQVNSTYGSRTAQTGMFVNTQLGYRDMLFLDLSGRRDVSSTLADTGNESYFYPAFGLTVLVDEMVDLPDFVSFAKLRTSYTNVAMPVPFNRVNPQHGINAGGGVDRNTKKPFTDLKPEMISSFEAGADWRFLDNRIGFDVTYYHINSKDQFIELPAPSGSGYTSYYVNAGSIVNKGIELTMNAVPIKTEDFSWQTALNYAQNTNKVEKLHDDLRNPITTGVAEGYDSKFVKDGSIGDIYVYKFKRDSQGRIMLDDDSKPRKTETTELIGNANPDWSLGWSNNLTYKGFSLGILFSAKFGGKVVSQAEAMLDGYGVSKRTADARDAGGVEIDAVDKDGNAVSKISARDYYTTIGGRNGIKEPYVYDRTNIRLSQLSLSYTLDTEKLNWSLNNIVISVVANNLFFLYKKAPFDPELAMNTGRDYQSLDNFNLPSTRTYGLNLQFNF